MNGINIQIDTLVKLMVDAEKCLFHNSNSNLMLNSLLDECVSPATVTSPSGLSPQTMQIPSEGVAGNRSKEKPPTPKG